MSTDLRTGPEKMFYNELEKLGAKVEAFIMRSPRDWFPDIYGYRVTRADGTQVVGNVPWDLDTYSTILKIAKGE